MRPRMTRAAPLALALMAACSNDGTKQTSRMPSVAEMRVGAEGSTTMRAGKQRATGQTKVHHYEPTAYDETADGPSLTEVRVQETFHGDIEGHGSVRVIQAIRPDKSATFVGIERVHGAIGGRTGSFLLQLHGTVVDQQMKAEWFVVPGSGTGALQGLRGEGGFTARLGQHGSIWLDYFFE